MHYGWLKWLGRGPHKRAARSRRVLADIDADYCDRSVEFLRHGVLLVFGAPLPASMLTGKEHGWTIPLADLAGAALRPARRASAPRRRRSKRVVERVRLRSRTRAAGSLLIAQAARRACERCRVLLSAFVGMTEGIPSRPSPASKSIGFSSRASREKRRRERSDPHIRDGDASPMVPPSPPSLEREPPRSADPCGATTGLAGSAGSVIDRTFMRHL
jgi:hypothetical protein